MPIATPEITPRCWTRPSRVVRVPGHQRVLLADPERRPGRLRRGRERRHRPGLHRLAQTTCPAHGQDMVAGSLAFAAYAAEVAKNYPVNIALHTDHCPKDKLDGFVRPLLALDERVKGGRPLFQSHMWDGSAVPLEENLQIAQELLAKAPRPRSPRGRDRRRRRRGGRRRGGTTRSCTPPRRTRWPPSRRSGPARTAAT